MTFYELYELLGGVSDQTMSVDELRRRLFAERLNAKEVTPGMLEDATAEAEVIDYCVRTAYGNWSDVRSYRPKTEEDYKRVMRIIKEHPDEYYLPFKD